MKAARPHVASPPAPFNASDAVIKAGERLYRVHGNDRAVHDFNPGFGQPTRFAFFGDPPVPVLYAATTQEAAVAESLLHEVPLAGGILSYEGDGGYADRLMGRVEATRDLRLASLHGFGLRQLNAANADVIDVHGPGVYAQTVAWAETAHTDGFDGLEWMSSRCNNARARVFFGDRVSKDDLVQDSTFARVFASSADFDWLVDMCAPLRVDVMPPIA